MELREIIFYISIIYFCAVLVWGTFKVSGDFTTEEKKY